MTSARGAFVRCPTWRAEVRRCRCDVVPAPEVVKALEAIALQRRKGRVTRGAAVILAALVGAGLAPAPSPDVLAYGRAGLATDRRLAAMRWARRTCGIAFGPRALVRGAKAIGLRPIARTQSRKKLQPQVVQPQPTSVVRDTNAEKS